MLCGCARSFFAAWDIVCLRSSNGFETMELCAREPVDAVVLDLDRNHAEVALIAREIKQRRPQVPTIVLTEAPAAVEGMHELADVLVPKENPPELVKSLQKLLSAAILTRRSMSK